MFCPKCATQNVEAAKFCRACGAALEVVALALDGKLVPREESSKVGSTDPMTEAEYLRKRAKAMRTLVTGGILVTVSLLILFTPMPFIREIFPWLVIWSALFGWVAVWGTISVAHGIGRLMDSQRLTAKAVIDKPATTARMLDGGIQVVVDSSRHYDATSMPGVTETTTRHLE
jgi:hypothetical protein